MKKNVFSVKKICVSLLALVMVLNQFPITISASSIDDDDFDYDLEYSVDGKYPEKTPQQIIHDDTDADEEVDQAQEESGQEEAEEQIDETAKKTKANHPHPLEPEVLPPAVKNYKYKVHKYDPKKFKKTPTLKEILKYYDKVKKEVKAKKPKHLKFNLDYDDYDLKFTDVPKDHKYRKEIIWAVANGVMKNQKKPFRPDELITLGEFLDMYWKLRMKYHIASKDDIEALYDSNNTTYYDGYQTIADKSNITPYVFVFFCSNMALNNIMLSPTSINDYNSKGAALHKHVYIPDRTMDYGDLFFIAAASYYEGITNPPGDDQSNTEDERRALIYNDKNKAEIFSSMSINTYFMTSKYIKRGLIDKKTGDCTQFLSSLPFRIGLSFMQAMGRVKLDPKVKDLQVDRKLTRAEMVDFLYDMAKYVKDGGYDVDFRVDWPVDKK